MLTFAVLMHEYIRTAEYRIVALITCQIYLLGQWIAHCDSHIHDWTNLMNTNLVISCNIYDFGLDCIKSTT